ncbi:MAG: hypothetical protein LBJ74_05550 [Heliobacteriaceae bacterium]|jgi:hypothetical protein|nr:hypothetical protein [Heliobacteriaceae bacterium]
MQIKPIQTASFTGVFRIEDERLPRYKNAKFNYKEDTELAKKIQKVWLDLNDTIGIYGHHPRNRRRSGFWHIDTVGAVSSTVDKTIRQALHENKVKYKYIDNKTYEKYRSIQIAKDGYLDITAIFDAARKFWKIPGHYRV